MKLIREFSRRSSGLYKDQKDGAKSILSERSEKNNVFFLLQLQLQLELQLQLQLQFYNN